MLTLLAMACTAPTTDTAQDSGPQAGPVTLELVEVVDINAVVATKGMDTRDGEQVYLWDYNQDQLQRWAGGQLSTLASGLVTSYGTDLAADQAGAVYVTKGGESLGETIMKWDGQTGAPLWGDDGLVLPGALLLGVDAADGALYVADGSIPAIRILSAEGVEQAQVPLDAVPLDVAVGRDGTLLVLVSAVSNPLTTGQPVYLQKVDADGAIVAGPVEVSGAQYLTRGEDGLVYVSTSDFDAPTRTLYAFDGTLTQRAAVSLPASYVGFAGGIAAWGSGAGLRIGVMAQEGVGSAPICDLLVYGKID